MTQQHRLGFDDPESLTRDAGLSVVRATSDGVEPFDINMFAGFTSLRALTYTASMRMIVGLLRDYEYDDFECVFGHSGIIAPDLNDVLAFQAVVEVDLRRAFVGVATSDARQQELFDLVASDKARFFVVKDKIAHAKIYLLEREGLRRVIVGSANLSETAFSGRQAETLIAFDNDETAWQHYTAQYEAVRSTATSRLAPTGKVVPAEQLPIEEIPALRDVNESQQEVRIYVPADEEEEAEISLPSVLQKVIRIKDRLRRPLAGMEQKRNGHISITPQIVRESISISRSRAGEDEHSDVYLSYDGKDFVLSGEVMSLEAPPEDVRGDVSRWLEFFGNYENGFRGDVARLQSDYFTFMSWFYFSPMLCDVRNAALRSRNFSFEQPMFAVLYGSSNCGKTSLIETLMQSMFSYPRMVETDKFTRSNLRGLRGLFKRLPVVFDDVTRDRFNRHAEEVIKQDYIQAEEYPCFALSMNAEARNFKDEIVKRCLMIYTRTSLPGDQTAIRNRLQRSISAIRDGMTTALYREYLNRIIARLGELKERGNQALADVDVLELSSIVLCDIFREHLPAGSAMPHWCQPMTLEEYQGRAWDRPRQVLENLLSRDKYTKDRKPPDGTWTVSGNMVLIGTGQMGAARTRNEIPDWILDDTASVANHIGLKRSEVEDFLGRKLRSRRWLPSLPW